MGFTGIHGGEGFPDRFGNVYIVRSAYGQRSFRRGDTNGDERLDLSDGIALLAYLFLGQRAPVCADAADSEDSGDLNISDAIRVLSYLFTSAAPPPAHRPDACGADPTADPLECEFFSCL